jgi:hypothetical protein
MRGSSRRVVLAILATALATAQLPVAKEQVSEGSWWRTRPPRSPRSPARICSPYLLERRRKLAIAESRESDQPRADYRSTLRGSHR